MSMFLLILMSMVLLILTIRQFLYTRGNIHFIRTNYHLNKLINKILTNVIKKFKNTWLKDIAFDEWGFEYKEHIKDYM